MALRIGILSAAHMHASSYAHAVRSIPEAQLVAVWDDQIERGQMFGNTHELPYVASLDTFLEKTDAVIITSENKKHSEHGITAARHNKHILCEKPLVTSESEGQDFIKAVKQAKVKLMTAFPCPFSPTFNRLKQRVENGDIGEVLAICSTNRGMWPGGWFVESELSGGGALIDHTVHVADLLWRLLKEHPSKVTAQVNHNIHEISAEDIAMLTLEYPSGIFATLDSSWSRPPSYKTWGDVTLNVVGTRGLIEVNLFNQSVDIYQQEKVSHAVSSYASNLDRLMILEFVKAIIEDRTPLVTGEDGLFAARVAFTAYQSLENLQLIPA